MKFGFDLVPYVMNSVSHKWGQDTLCNLIQFKFCQKVEQFLPAGRSSDECISTLQEPLSLYQPPQAFSSLNLSSLEKYLGWGFLPHSHTVCKTFHPGWRCPITHQILLLVEVSNENLMEIVRPAPHQAGNLLLPSENESYFSPQFFVMHSGRLLLRSLQKLRFFSSVTPTGFVI